MYDFAKKVLVAFSLIVCSTACCQGERNDLIYLTAIKMDSINRALSYGSQALDVLDIRDRQLVNEKAKVLQYEGLVEAKSFEVITSKKSFDVVVDKYFEFEKGQKKVRRKKWWDGFGKGIVIGALTGAGLIVLSQ